jgi:peptidoglycan hydrolase CwlO-like protein
LSKESRGIDLKKKITALGTIVILGISSIASIPAVKAESNLQSIQGQRSGIQVGITQANAEISQVQNELASLNEQIKRVDQAIQDNNNMIAQTQVKMAASQTEVQQLNDEITVIKDRIEKRNNVLKKRAQSFQESGGQVSYFDVLLGASSFSDFVNRIGAVATIVEADQDLVKQHEADKQEIQDKQAAVEQKLAEYKNMMTEFEGMQAQINEQKSQNDALKADLTAREQQSLSEKSSLQQQDQTLALQQSQLTQPARSQTTSSPVFSPVSVPAGSGSINDVIKAGYRYIGNSVYVFGGGRSASDIANGRFDCSGFVHWAFSQAGVSVGSSTDSLKNEGSSVPASQMRPGDLVFFDTYKQDGHVGIYIGGGKFIGSQSSTGVAIADMSGGYWGQNFNGRVKRIMD